MDIGYWAITLASVFTPIVLGIIGYLKIPKKPIEPEKVYDLRPLNVKVKEIVDARKPNGRLIAERKDLLLWQDKFDLLKWRLMPDEEEEEWELEDEEECYHSEDEECRYCVPPDDPAKRKGQR